MNLGVLHSECKAPPSKERHLNSQIIAIDDSGISTLTAKQYLEGYQGRSVLCSVWRSGC